MTQNHEGNFASLTAALGQNQSGDRLIFRIISHAMPYNLHFFQTLSDALFDY